MANNRIYANFLMHGRTKGSRNGVSTTKGYTAVGQKAKGKIINGRYVYDYYTPYGMKNSTITEGYTPLAAISTREQHRLEQVAKNNEKARENKQKAENYARVKAMNYAFDKKYGYKEMGKQAASQEWRDKQERAESEEKKKMYSQAANAERDTLARRNSVAKGAVNNWQQQAAYQQQKEAARNRAAASAAKGAANNWQAKANAARAMTEYAKKAETARDAKEAVRSASYNKMSSTQKNAMKGDPRYTSNKPGPLFTSRDPKYGYSGKNDPRAPVFKESTWIDMYGNKTGGKEIPMDRDPYFESWSKATNKQESAKAQAWNKAFTNAFEESKKRNSRSDIGNAVADFKEEAKAKAKSLFKKKKKKKK